MYYIDSLFEEPDIDYMVARVKENLRTGIAVHDNTELYNKLLNAQQAAAANMRNIYGIANPNSVPQLQTYLENNMDGYIEEICYVNGKLTTNKDAMQQLAHKGYQFALDLLTYRRAKKYAENIKSIMDATEDGVVRPIMSLGKTNRVNYREPALMNIPKKLIWNVIAPRKEGNILISVDIKNQEPWILINMLNIEMLRDRLSADDKDGLYNLIFEELYGKTPSAIERQELKTAWNALTYGATKFGMMSMCKNFDGERLYKFFSSIPELKDYRGKCFAQARRKQQKVETYFGTELYADTLGNNLSRVLMDLPIQGTGSDILALLIKHADEEFEDRGIDEYIAFYFSRHDELIFEASREWVEEIGLDAVFTELRDIMEHQVDDWEPFRVEIGVVEPCDIIEYGEDDEE